VYCSVLQCVAVCCSVLHQSRLSVSCVLQCVAVCCSVLQCVASISFVSFLCIAVCCSVLQCVAVCCINLVCQSLDKRDWCNTLQHTATHCNTLQYTRNWQTRLMLTNHINAVLIWLVCTWWRRLVGCLLFVGHFPQKSPTIRGSLAESDLQLKAPYGSSLPCHFHWTRV